jgi:hypothetical protein
MDHFMYDEYGDIFYGHDVDVTVMMIPVRCLRCNNGIYDLTKVEVTERYTDCSVWMTPCCNVSVDDRTWPGRAAYVRLDHDGYDARR